MAGIKKLGGKKMGQIKKIDTILTAKGKSDLLDLVRKRHFENTGREMKSETDWTIDGVKINSGTIIDIVVDSKKIRGRFELSSINKPIVVTENSSINIKENMQAFFID